MDLSSFPKDTGLVVHVVKAGAVTGTEGFEPESLTVMRDETVVPYP
ncbi:hypothetical protein [Embleya sp. NBC_00896]|nr:hypothetical protein OG928_27760 [Embleya sp. NBC_00896]